MPTPLDAPPLEEGWLELDRAAAVEVTLEEKEYPVESALVLGELRGWRAAASGTQTIRLHSYWSSNRACTHGRWFSVLFPIDLP
jgi:hypothetical protein